MVSNFKRFKVTMVLTIASLFILGFSQFSTVVFSSFFERDLFQEQTSIGPISLSGKSREQAASLLEEQIKTWQENASFELKYKESSQKVDPNSFKFLVGESIESAIDGKENSLIVEVNQQNIENTLQQLIPKTDFHALDMTGLLNALSSAASELDPSLTVRLEDFLPKEEPVVVATASRQLDGEFTDIEKFVHEFPQISIEPLTNVSLNKLLEGKKLNQLSSHQMSVVSSGLFEALLSTNFTITDRNIGRELLENIKLGLEAKVDFSKKIDFSFYNPNENRYDIKLLIDRGNLEISIIGIPFSSKYQMNLTEKQEFKPRTIKRYTPLLEPRQKSVETEGKPGLMIKVYRETISSSGELIQSELISEDFYQPIHRVEVHGIDPNSNQIPQPEEQGTESLANTDNNGSSMNETPTVNTENQSPATNEQNDPDEGTDDSGEDRLWGKPNEEPK
ncbi:VanW family protein [Bacillus sp. ISL-35]|uniref:G5 domain-containing protein n=1 Tax=Bacillus sp. ISL-35 TaxID=2819122 RepID=UPI001BE6F551|nr:G5 domain-containing protein [Bacillus sp. ISL-35]MBT2681650.1 VanW family protein [Bacillus sp. ISL-35]MBT2702314.1 VanW family protein [Chryseobacterium sp. ISL-80]